MIAKTKKRLGVFMVVMSVAVFALMIYGMVNVSGLFALMMFAWLAVVSVGVVLINSGYRNDPVQTVPDPEPVSRKAQEPDPFARQGNGSGYCPSCGAPLNASDSFCGVCGRRL